MTPKVPQSPGAIITALQTFIMQYVTFVDSAAQSFVAALWALGTFLHPQFDAFPYLVITSHTKRSGKTRFSEVLSFLSSNTKNMTGVTPATVFRSIKDEAPTIIVDEAESMSGNRRGAISDHMMRSVMNSGYRKGQTVPRMGKGGIEEWPTYCPKVFVLIGDVYDTLRDRSIVMTMQRADQQRRFLFEQASLEGAELRERAADLLNDLRSTIAKIYDSHAGLPFLSDRDEEIWTPLFVLCEALAPERLEELTRIAADMATEKTAEARRYVTLLGEEKKAEDDEYARRLVRDLSAVIDGRKGIFTADAIEALKALPTGPWRKFRGAGLTAIDMGNLLSRFGLTPKLIRLGGRDVKPQRGYLKAWVTEALDKLGK